VGAVFSERLISGRKTRDPYQARFLLKLISGWEDLTALLLVQALEETHFF